MRDEKTTKGRNFATIFYEDSMPSDLVKRLESLRIPAFISPLHDKDLNEDGSPKKAHYHVMFMFSGNKTIEQVRSIVTQLGGVGVLLVADLRANARYLCHLDSDDSKAKYSIDDVISLSGADYKTTINLAKDKYNAIAEMVDYCVENDIVSYAELFIYAKNNNFMWFRVLCDNSTTVYSFLKSLGWDRDIYRSNRRKIK